jgi:hypothetical protein
MVMAGSLQRIIALNALIANIYLGEAAENLHSFKTITNH